MFLLDYDTPEHRALQREDIDLLKIVVANTNDIIAINHPDGTCLYISPSVQKVLGYSPDELVGTAIYRFYPPDDAARIRELYCRAMAGLPAPGTRFEYQVRKKDGSYAWLESEATRIVDSAGCLIKSLVISRDITDRRQAEELKQESWRRLCDFAQAIPDVSLIIDEDGCLLEAFGKNNGLLCLSKEIRGLFLRQVFPANYADLLLGIIKLAVQTGAHQHYIRELALPDSSRVTEGRVAPLRYLASGKKTAAVVIADITEQQRTKRMLELAFMLRRRTDFVNDIVQGKPLDARLMATAKALALDLSIPLYCWLLHIQNDEQQPAAGLTAEHVLRQTNLIDLLSSNQRLFVWDCHGDIGIISQISDTSSVLDASLQAAARLLHQIAAYDPGLSITIGIGDAQDGLAGIKKSFRQAENAAIVARTSAKSRICHFRQMGIFQFLAHFSEAEETDEFVQARLAKLLDYDQRKGADMLHTLEEILRSSSLKEAAQKLYLHYNTALFRKRRIEKILGVNLDEFETKVVLDVALKLYRLRS